MGFYCNLTWMSLFLLGTERQLFDGFILKINKALSFANFELRACIDQYDGQVYYGVVNTVSDEHSKLGTKYSVPQIAFYKAIVSFAQLHSVFLSVFICVICSMVCLMHLAFAVLCVFLLCIVYVSLDA